MVFKVMLAIDSSEHADYALHYYMDNLHQEDNVLILIHVIDAQAPGYMASVAWDEALMSGEVWDDTVAQAREQAKELEEEYSRKLTDYNIQGRYLRREGYNTGEVIIETAEKEGANLIALGSRGLGTIRRTILGSVSEYVMHHAYCPVIICHKEEQDDKE